ncbi:hypothetical protein Ae168Ps1_1666c [Pseudonocardia sp. Ae168_Ps1]|uniref:hypothetical protein n=1 Tax=unclassified Pseudonocardia TaxID=2619320 RepID=UPI0001FFE369|nr:MULTISPECIES: hypothetical protein [unclassified Pseudonocardia]ALE72708.1 hypothetical protein FRP1_05590 [Pseudonocardia sp. EC080625-04]ALL76019.1 hypothetical protein AD006_13220 [Pseudonocardia sp. EC080610-09]ALL83047.1 hypothetical protein AD017_21055 [Pseudonocardia sp. EC080619-01]OLL73282.1 hypothetical protein Ae150APs1_1660c [Pseudonocardia sp. Ae150A_Ps1]OLL79260.1 hypothetical protein Ae168Ps1_1666c [Pseudonocardia sp. Ae168_Ps1]
MRHLQGVVIGLVGTVLALAVAGRGMGTAFEASMRMQLDAVPAGAALLLLGGVLLGGVALAVRVSPAAPLTGAVLLILLSAYSWFDPQALFGLGRGLGYLLGLQYGALLAGMLAVVAFLRPRRTRPAGPAIPAPGSSGPVVH